ncbi:tunicamycin resistance protein [Clostridia bacterium]|nr:tunicamycin resistance protein [Clostridia bacterium]
MIIWINGAFGSGKTTVAYELNRRLADSFVYDPENAGFFIRKNLPEAFSSGDFQDIELWREMNYRILKSLYSQYSGTVIVPMTLVNPDYYNEIVGKLIAEGIAVRHFILYASREEIKRRLSKRSFHIPGRERFAVDAIERCVNAFDTVITEEKIDTEHINADEITEKIAETCGLQLLPEKKTRFQKAVYRFKIWMKHIR